MSLQELGSNSEGQYREEELPLGGTPKKGVTPSEGEREFTPRQAIRQEKTSLFQRFRGAKRNVMLGALGFLAVSALGSGFIAPQEAYAGERRS